MQKVLGEVGPNTKGVQRMLERVGFRYVERIDPFDGGPHFEANTSDVTLIRRYRTLKLAEEDFELEGDDVMVAVERDSGPQPLPRRALQRAPGQPGGVPAREGEGGPGRGARGAKLSIIPFE